eukprot:gene29042-32244_t
MQAIIRAPGLGQQLRMKHATATRRFLPPRDALLLTRPLVVGKARSGAASSPSAPEVSIEASNEIDARVPVLNNCYSADTA